MDAVDLVFQLIIVIFFGAGITFFIIGINKWLKKDKEKGNKNIIRMFLCWTAASFFSFVINGINGKIFDSVFFGLITAVAVVLYVWFRRESKNVNQSAK